MQGAEAKGNGSPCALAEMLFAVLLGAPLLLGQRQLPRGGLEGLWGGGNG